MFGFACVCSQCYIIFVPSRPSDPMLATTSIISELKPGKTTVILSSPRTVNGEEPRTVNGEEPAATWMQSGSHPGIRNTHSLEHRRCQDHNLASRINHKVNLNSLAPPCQEPRSRRAKGPDHNHLSTILRRLMSLNTDVGWDIHAVSSAEPIILASGRRIGESGCSISSGTVTMSNWFPPSSLPLWASEPESPVSLQRMPFQHQSGDPPRQQPAADH